MFSKFTTIFHNAVEAFAPSMPLQQDFVHHWKAVTHYFVDHKDQKVSIEQTSIPYHLDQMLEILTDEEAGSEDGSTGPCMEYMLQHKILETLYTLARTDCPPGMKQKVLQFFTKLLSHIQQPLLPHVNVHRAVHRLIRVCGEFKATPTENEEIQFLCTVSAQIKMTPYLVNFFLDAPKPLSNSSPTSPDSKNKAPSQFNLVNSLLTLMQSADGRIAVKACEGLMLIASLPEQNAATVIVKHTQFCQEMARRLCDLYRKFPKTMDPVDIEGVDANWGLDILSDAEDRVKFKGKRQLISFLSWLDFCDQLIIDAYPLVAKALSTEIREQFLCGIIEPALMETSEVIATMATAHLNMCLRHITSRPLLTEFVYFILGYDRNPEVPDEQGYKIRQRLIERCDHLSEEMSIVTLKLFESLIVKPHSHIAHNLALRNLLGRGYYEENFDFNDCSGQSGANKDSDSTVPVVSTVPDISQVTESNVNQTSEQSSEEKSDSDVHKDEQTESSSSQVSPPGVENVNSDKENTEGQQVESSQSENVNQSADQSQQETHDTAESCKTDKSEHSVETSDQSDAASEIKSDQSAEKEGIDAEKDDSGIAEDTTSAENPVTTDKLAESSQSSHEASPQSEGSNIQKVVNCLLCLVPEQVKSSHHATDSGYDTYLRDAHRQVTHICRHCSEFKWPVEPLYDPEYQTMLFYEGDFLKVVLDKLSHMLDQSYDVNLQVTCIVSRLAQLPHANLHEFLLNPFLPLREGCRSLYTVLLKVANDVQSRLSQIPEFDKKLMMVRKQLMGTSNSIRRMEDSNLLEGAIVLEEFCKELAAIAFVKHHTLATQLHVS